MSGGRKIACGHSRRAWRARHGAANAERPSLIAGRAHHTAGTGAADHDRLAAKLGPATNFDRREERVHVDVQDRAPDVVRWLNDGLSHARTLTDPYDQTYPLPISNGIVISATVAEPWNAMRSATCGGSV